jgi:AraC-like DNA-binding protein
MIYVTPITIAETPETKTVPPREWGTGVSILAQSQQRGSRGALHRHEEAQLLFASHGVMQVTTPSGRWLVPPARAVWLPPRFEHVVDSLSDIEMRTLYVDPEWLAAHPEAARLDRAFVVAVRPLLRHLILGLFDPTTDRRRTNLLVQLALYELIEAEDTTTFVPMPIEKRARRVAELVLADPGGDRELGDLASEAGASARTITRLFPAETQLTFKEWRQRARIMAAVEALGGGGVTIKHIAARTGFASPAAFGHAFRQVMGMTPGEVLGRAIKAWDR